VASQPLIALARRAPNKRVQLLTVLTNPGDKPWEMRRVSQFWQDDALSAGDSNSDGNLELLLGRNGSKTPLNGGDTIETAKPRGRRIVVYRQTLTETGGWMPWLSMKR